MLNSRHGQHAAQRAVFCSRMQTPSNVQSSRPSWAASSALADVRSAGPASTMHCGRSSRLRSGQGASWRAGLTASKKGPSAKIAGGSSSSWGGRRRPKALQAIVRQRALVLALPARGTPWYAWRPPAHGLVAAWWPMDPRPRTPCDQGSRPAAVAINLITRQLALEATAVK